MTAPEKTQGEGGADWFVTIRVRLRNMVEHDHEDGTEIVRELINEESLGGFADWPDDYEVLSIEQATRADAAEGGKQ